MIKEMIFYPEEPPEMNDSELILLANDNGYTIEDFISAFTVHGQIDAHYEGAKKLFRTNRISRLHRSLAKRLHFLWIEGNKMGL